MLQIPFILAILLGTAFAALAKEVKIGDASIALTMPAGYCELDGKNAADTRVLTATEKLVAGGGNQLLAFSAECEQLSDWRAGKRRLLDNFAQYQTRVSLIDKPLPVPPTEVVKQICAAGRTQGEKIVSVLAPDIHARIEETLRRVKMNETRFLGVLDEDSTACYAALLQKLQTEIGTDKAQIAVFATTIVKGKFVYFYLFAPYAGAETVNATLTKVKSNVAALVGGNKN